MYILVGAFVALLEAIVGKPLFVSVLNIFIGGPCKEAASGRKGCCGVSAGLVCGFSCFRSVVGFVCSLCSDLCFLFRLCGLGIHVFLFRS